MFKLKIKLSIDAKYLLFFWPSEHWTWHFPPKGTAPVSSSSHDKWLKKFQKNQDHQISATAINIAYNPIPKTGFRLFTGHILKYRRFWQHFWNVRLEFFIYANFQSYYKNSAEYRFWLLYRYFVKISENRIWFTESTA